jgi:integrase/recombinase XerD
MAEIKFWRVNSFYDRHGRLRHVCRIPGKKAFTLPGRPGSVEFMEAYQEALGDEALKVEIGNKNTKPGTLNEAIVKYYKSERFTEGLAAETQKMRRAILERFRAMCGASGQSYGEKRIAHLREDDIKVLMKPMTRHAQKNWLKAMRGLMAFALAENPPLIKSDPTKGIKVAKPFKKSMGFKSWLEPQVEQYRQHHPLGTTARLALELLLNIAARRYDAHVIGPQNVIISNKDGLKKLCWRPHKTLRTTGKMLKIKMLPSLQAALDAMPKPERGTEVPLAFLTNDYGKPFASAAAFGNKFADWCKAAGLKPVLCEDGKVRNYRAHGLRKAALRALAHARATLPELMAVSGHASPEELLKYIEEVEQEDMADNAMDRLAGTAK